MNKYKRSRSMRGICFLLLFCFAASCVKAEEEPPEKKRMSDGVPDYESMMFKNLLVPGTAQLALGQNREAAVYLMSLPLTLIGNGLSLYATFVRLGGIRFDVENDGRETFLFRYNEEEQAFDQLFLFAGLTLSLYGALLSNYSQYAAHRDFVDDYLPSFSSKIGRESLGELLVAPFLPRNVFTVDVLPALVLFSLSDIAGQDLTLVRDFFLRETVPFMGFAVRPITGLGLQALSAMLLVWANATWEEIAFRGLSLETSGAAYSSLTFGVSHLTNMLSPGVSVEDTVLQSVFAAAFGFYTAEQVKRNGYKISRMVALHFWQNVIAFTLGYVFDPEEMDGFSIRYNVRF